MRKATSFTISSDILSEIASSKGDRSTSDRVNTLLRKALELERRERLEEEAAEFFKNAADHVDSERAAFLRASKKALSRD
jgi:hypothetical protein